MNNYPEDSRYPAICYKPLNKDDMIDFPCSSVWLNYYHELGLTPKQMQEPQAKIEAINILNLIDDINKLRSEAEKQRKEIEKLKKITPKPTGFKPIQEG